MFARAGTQYVVKKMVGGLTGGESSAIINLLVVCIILIGIAFFGLCMSEKYRAKKEGRKPQSPLEILGFSSKFTWKHIMVGMASNIIFGMIDNGGLFFGMDALDPILPTKPGEDLLKAGYGNTFSDMLGSFLGTFVGNTISNVSQIDQGPLWAEVIGIVIGCLLGMFIPSMITGKR